MTPTAPRPDRLEPDSGPTYLLPEEVADLLRVSPKTVERWSRQDPTMPVLRLGGKGGAVRFPKDRLLRWLEQRTQGPTRPRSAPGSAPR